MFAGNLLLMAPQTGRSQHNPHNAAAMMIELAERVELLGHHMKYLFPTEAATLHAGRGHLAVAKILTSKRMQATLRVPVRSREDSYCLRWPKDNLQSFANGIAISKAPILAAICAKIGATKMVVSPWCEGGLFIRARGVILASSAAKHARKPSKIVSNYYIHRVPKPDANCAYRNRYGIVPRGKTHIDLDCCLLQTPGDERLLLVAEPYLQVYRREIYSAATEISALICIVPEREFNARAVNLIALPPNAVIIPSRCPWLRGMLQEHFGEGGVVVAKIGRDFNYNGGIGGLGCMSSVIEPCNFDHNLL